MEDLKIQGTVLTPASGDAYVAALKRNSDLSQLLAQYVVQPVAFEDIPPVLAFASSQSPPLEVAVKCGGVHASTWASSDGGVVIDLTKLNRVALAEDKKSVRVEGGALWGDVYEVTAPAGLDVVGSPLWFVGVGGFTTGGGYGPLSGEYGLAIDNLVETTVVLADGRIVKASKDEEPDLFWAIRGGGGQFGIVVEFVFKVHPGAGPYSSGILAFPGGEPNVEGLAKTLSEWQKTQTPSERFGLHFSRPAPHFKPSMALLPMVMHDPDGSRAQTVLAPLRTGTPVPVFEKIASAPDMRPISHAADASMASAPRRLVIRGAFYAGIHPELLLGVWRMWEEFTASSEEVKGSGIIWDLTSPEAVTKVAPEETALPVRTPHYWMAAQGRSTTDESVPACREFAERVTNYVREKNAELFGRDLGFFLSMAQGDERAENVWGENLPRLRKIKAKYDPKKTFHKGVAIEPLFE